MKDCWINPNGELIKVGLSQHNEYAYELLVEEMGMRQLRNYMRKYNCQSSTEVLHMRGWIRIKYSTHLKIIQILGNCIDLTRAQRNTIDPKMNSKQLKVAKRLCKENNTTLHMAVNDKRFW